MTKNVLTFLLTLLITPMLAQNTKVDTTFMNIPKHPDHYSNKNIVIRLIDGLGYRYYWATNGLKAGDLKFKISEDSRSTLETLEHLLEVSQMILNTTLSQENIQPFSKINYSLNELRNRTLLNLKEAKNNIQACVKLSDLKLIFNVDGKKIQFPFWNLLNGPISDSIYHIGQIVSFRRANGNPIDSNINMLTGKNNN